MKSDVMFYYLRSGIPVNDKNAKRGVPFGVVAVRLNEDGTVNRGVAVCSPIDKYNKDAGRGIALSRLLHAEEVGDSLNAFQKYSVTGNRQHFPADVVANVFNRYKFKCGYHEPILENEHRMFFKPEDR